MSPANLLLLYLLSTQQLTIHAQQCLNGLSSPPTVAWTPSTTSTSLRTTLTFDVATKIWNDGAISLTTRLFNHLLPAPTMRIERGKTYEILLVNNLGAELEANAALTANQERDPNTTNLHTHGLHISGLSPADDVFARVNPGANITYIYNIPCSHSGGIHWYHPHHHPSVQLHVAGGAAGAIIVEDDAIEEALPDWYTNMRELVLFINHIDSKFIRTGYPKRDALQNANQKVLQLTPRFDDVYIVNGEYQPTICTYVGEWIKFRFAQTEIRDPQKYEIGNEAECTLKLLARDGVIVNNPPRDISNIVWLAESSRADVAISCNAGIHAITVLRTDGDVIIAYIHVEEATNSTAHTQTLSAFEPKRPSYLRDLRNYTADSSLKMKIRFDGIVINDGSHLDFDASDPYFAGVNEISLNSINEWRLVPDDFGVHHPFHIHVNHFQIIAGPKDTEGVPSFQSGLEAPNGWQQVGDYLDTIWGASTIRFAPDIWGGPLVIHCHRLEHEVGGAMGAVYVYNGCDSEYNDYNEVGSCNIDPDECLTSNPTIVPTAIPTMIPSIEPTLEPTNVPTLEPSAKPTLEPTIEPSYIPTHDPIVKPTNIPTVNPTIDPSYTPSVDPTTAPSNIPSVNPTNTPTDSPSVIPSLQPTNNPTILPSLTPSYTPTYTPSDATTVSPTVRQTSVPSVGPVYNTTTEATLSPTYDMIYTSVMTTGMFSTETKTTENMESIVYIVKETEFVEGTESYTMLRSGMIYGIISIAVLYMTVIIICVIYNRDGRNDLQKKDRKNTADTGSQLNSSTFNVTMSSTQSPSTGPIFVTLNNSMDTINEEDPSILAPIAPNAFKQWEKDYDCKSSETSVSQDSCIWHQVATEEI